MENFCKPRVVISRCIEFDYCRWNGNIISSKFVQRFKKYADFVPICPEVEIGLGIPRKPIRVVRIAGEDKLLQLETDKDFTQKMQNFAGNYLSSLNNIDGFILKERSPSCGERNVKLYPTIEKSSPLPEKSKGFFAREVLKQFSTLPVENEGRLNNLFIREHFLTKLYTLAEFRLLKSSATINDLINFQKKHKLLLMGYNQSVMHKMGRVIAAYNKTNLPDIIEEYQELLFKAFKTAPRYTSNINVLMHAAGYFKKFLNSQEKQFFNEQLELYRLKKISLSSCNILINSWIARFNEEYLAGQSFFNPYPADLNSKIEYTHK